MESTKLALLWLWGWNFDLFFHVSQETRNAEAAQRIFKDQKPSCKELWTLRLKNQYKEEELFSDRSFPDYKIILERYYKQMCC